MLIAAPSGHAASTASPLYSTFLTRVIGGLLIQLESLGEQHMGIRQVQAEEGAHLFWQLQRAPEQASKLDRQ